MISLLPWSRAYLESRRWNGVRRHVERCSALARAHALPQALLIVGEAGLGREALAVALAAALICRDAGTPGCQCHSCDRLWRGVHPDLEVVDVDIDEKTGKKKSEIGIEHIRSVTERLRQRPFEGRRRVVIVVSAQTPPLNTHSASAMLKSLEEPPEHVTWLLLAGNPARVLPTIASRSVLVRVPPPERSELIDVLAAAHDLDRERAEAHAAACLDDAALALQVPAAEGGGGPAELRGRVRALLAGDALAALTLGVRAKAAPETIPALARLLLAEAAAASPETAERAIGAAARLLAGDLRRAVLHLDPEGVTVGALAGLLRV